MVELHVRLFRDRQSFSRRAYDEALRRPGCRASLVLVPDVVSGLVWRRVAVRCADQVLDLGSDVPTECTRRRLGRTSQV